MLYILDIYVYLSSRCGQSKDFPYCDGSHEQYNKDTGKNIEPLEVKKPEGMITASNPHYWIRIDVLHTILHLLHYP